MEEARTRSAHRPLRLRGALLLVLCLALLGGGGLGAANGCQQVDKPATIEDGAELDSALRAFHKNMRWARYEQAAHMVDESYQQKFLGMYEEHGDDFHITELEIKDVKFEEGDSLGNASKAIIEVEQQWYKEPNMVVKKERFIEVWGRSREGWRLSERVEREVWRERKRAKKEGEAQEASEESTPTEAATSPEETPTP